MKTEDTLILQNLIQNIGKDCRRPVRLMEFCGGHTVAILKFGIRQLLPRSIHMFSGPGCPVCVTSSRDIDKIISLAQHSGIIITTFGDLVRVPGSRSSLQCLRAEGKDIRIVYSVLEAMDIARQNPEQKVVMVGIGFETTAPAIAASLIQAQNKNISNYYVLSLHKLTPPVIKAILETGETRIDGIVGPGHVSTIIGSKPYNFIPRNYHIGCVITGFEQMDILMGLSMLVKQIGEDQPEVEIAYSQAVREEGNLRAQQIMSQVFDISAATWRGIGEIPGSGLKLKPEFQSFDAEKFFNLTTTDTNEPDGCICGDILRGVKIPSNCSLFQTVCNPENPVGPCMVSSEGACSAYYVYGGCDE